MGEEFPTEIVHLTEDELGRQLAVLEARFGMTSAAFLCRFNAGLLGHDLEFIRWAGLLRIASKAGLWPPARA